MNTDTAITMLLAMGVAAAVSFLATPMVKSLAYKVGAIDVPKDNRRMHKVPMPRLGGLAIFLAFLLSWFLGTSTGRCRGFCSARP